MIAAALPARAAGCDKLDCTTEVDSGGQWLQAPSRVGSVSWERRTRVTQTTGG